MEPGRRMVFLLAPSSHPESPVAGTEMDSHYSSTAEHLTGSVMSLHHSPPRQQEYKKLPAISIHLLTVTAPDLGYSHPSAAP
jgi:hypothetical protein